MPLIFPVNYRLLADHEEAPLIIVRTRPGNVIASAGEHDPMVPMVQLREWVPDAVQFERAGHNAHVETPGALVALLTRIADLASV